MEGLILKTSDTKKLQDIISKIVELNVDFEKINKSDLLDLGLGKAIIEGRNSGEVDRESIFKELKS